MDWNDAVQRRAFFAIYEGLPRQGPGSTDLTRRALDLALASGLEPRVVFDLGSGSGLQSGDLARSLPAARVVALDRHLPFVAAADARTDHLAGVVGDMAQLPWAGASADLIWSEGAAYFVGIENALDDWVRYLRPGGVLAFSECVWLTRSPGARIAEFWQAYPQMRHVDDWLPEFARRDLELLGSFVLPREAWWQAFYVPMLERLDRLEVEYADQPSALAVLAESRGEIDLWRAECGDTAEPSYSYAFYVLKYSA